MQNPFVAAWMSADFIGKMIFLSLFALSLLSWTLLFYKWWVTSRVRDESFLFKKVFLEHKDRPLDISYMRRTHREIPNAFYMMYDFLRSKTLSLLEKNEGTARSRRLSQGDIDSLEGDVDDSISLITRYLEKNLYVLSTIVTLAPFLGLLGTVYGILVTFSHMGAELASNQQILEGLSLALTTTVLGLLNAIPALVGYNYLQHSIAAFHHDMERFAREVVSTLRFYYVVD